MSEADGESFVPVSILRQYFVPIVLGCMSLLFVGISISIFIKTNQQETPIRFETDAEASPSGRHMPGRLVVVDVEGAVNAPGVYRIPADSRVEDALVAAGGLSREADMETFARLFNRAARLEDGAKLFVPSYKDDERVFVPGDASDQTVNINSADRSGLESLPGIGPVTAGKIEEGRPYTRIEELLEKKIIGERTFESLKNRLTL